jgi:Prokaryotic cytochrome b561
MTTAVTDLSTTTPSTPTKRRLPARLMLDIVVDVLLLIAFTIDSNTSLTGLTIHEWLGVAFGIAFMFHLALHWDWVLRTARRILENHPGRDRLKWFVDLLLYVVVGGTVVSGWYISRHAAPALGIHPVHEQFFRSLHGDAANISVVLVGLHLGLNWRWLRSTWIRCTRRSRNTG